MVGWLGPGRPGRMRLPNGSWRSGGRPVKGPVLVWFVVIGLVWGASFLFIRVLIDAGMSPMGVGGARSALGVLALAPVAWARRGELPRRPGTWAAIAALGALNIAGPWTLIPLGQERISSGMASIANATAPLWAVVFTSMLLAAERLTSWRLTGVLLGLAGVVVLSADGLRGFDGSTAAGTALVCTATCAYGFAVVAIRRWFASVPPTALAVGQIGTGALFLMPLALVSGGFNDAVMGAGEWASLLVLGLVGSGAIFLLYMDLVSRVGGVRAIVVTYLMPPVGVLLGWMVLDESIGWKLGVSLVLTLAGVSVVQGAGGWAFGRWARRNARLAE